MIAVCVSRTSPKQILCRLSELSHHLVIRTAAGVAGAFGAGSLGKPQRCCHLQIRSVQCRNTDRVSVLSGSVTDNLLLGVMGMLVTPRKSRLSPQSQFLSICHSTVVSARQHEHEKYAGRGTLIERPKTISALLHASSGMSPCASRPRTRRYSSPSPPPSAKLAASAMNHS